MAFLNLSFQMFVTGRNKADLCVFTFNPTNPLHTHTCTSNAFTDFAGFLRRWGRFYSLSSTDVFFPFPHQRKAFSPPTLTITSQQAFHRCLLSGGGNPFLFCLLGAFIRSGCWVWWAAFSALLEMTICFSFSRLFMRWMQFIDCWVLG